MAERTGARDNARQGFQTLQKTLSDVGWDPEPTGEEGVLRIDFSADPIPIGDAIAKVLFDAERFIFYLNFRDRASHERLGAVTEFITLANYGLILGNFELSYEDGSLRYKSSIDFTQVQLSELLIRNAVLSAMDTVEQYGDELVAVIRGERTPREALEAAEVRGDL